MFTDDVLRRRDHRRVGDVDVTDSTTLSFLKGRRFVYLHCTTERDSFDGEVSVSERRAAGTWSIEGDSLLLVGREGRAQVDYKHCADEDTTELQMPEADFRMTIPRADLDKWSRTG